MGSVSHAARPLRAASQFASRIDLMSIVISSVVLSAAFVRWSFRKYTEWITNPSFKKDVAFIRDLAMDVVGMHREDLRNQSSMFKNSDLMQMFVTHAEEHGEVNTDEELADHVLNFIIACRDTIAQTLQKRQKVEPLL
ncbi:hypothetical protein BJ742DRAFT_769886 [Cladochytrium replicatum]|nr:hypothetical protein BJ742DRAFT_769886 [Cladochytrium replicatum]